MKSLTYVTAVAPGVYGSSVNSAQLTVSGQGVVTAVTTVPVTLPSVATIQTQRCMVTTQTPQARTAGTFQTFTIVNWDPASMFNGTDAITIPSTGIYQVFSGTTHTFGVGAASRLNINSGAYFIAYTMGSNATNTSSTMLTWQFNAGDVIRQECYLAYSINSQPNCNYMGVARIA